MQFGKWELRDDASYYLSKDSIIWPSSNAVDEGKLTTEENLRSIYRDIINKNYVLKYNYFSLTLNPTRTAVIVSPGEAIIQGYHLAAKNSVEVKVPDNRVKNSDGSYAPGPIIQYTLGISLSYDAANHVTGDVVNKEAEVGESETLSGVYLKWFDECELECNYDNILVLGRAWIQNGAIVKDGTNIDGRIIYHGFEQDPFKDHRFDSNSIELTVYGHHTTMYDTLRDNMTQIHEQLYTYDSMHFPIELDRQERTKPPTHVTDIQDWANHIPDWYTSKYGDYMTGALRFNNLSLDAMREFNSTDKDEENNTFVKDSINNKFADSVLISPRTYGDLTRTIGKYAASVIDPVSGKQIGLNYDYNVGGTIMSIVPGTYSNTTDNNNGYTGIHAALLAQKYGDTGLRIHYGNGNENSINDYTRLVQYNETDTGLKYVKYDEKDVPSKNTSKFIIENVNNINRKVSIDFKDGELFIDSFNSPESNPINETKITDSKYNGDHYGSGIQLFTSSAQSDENRNIDFRIDEYDISMANHKNINHRTATRGNIHTGDINDTLHFKMGLGMSYEGQETSISDIYAYMDNLLIKSNVTPIQSLNGESALVKQNTIEVFNTGDAANGYLNYIRILPRVYSKQFLAEDIMQIGTSRKDDYYNDEAESNTVNKILIKKVKHNGYDDKNSYTYLEQTYNFNNDNTDISRVLNKMIPPIDHPNLQNENDGPKYEEISGIYSSGNIGCSSTWLTPGDNNGDNNNPYADDKEWVRFTKFRYDIDKDSINGGSNGGNYEVEHDSIYGRKWGAPYNIEFNTNIANERANQIIWRFNGSTGKQTDISLENTPPVVLSYIHDSTVGEPPQGTPTKYTNWEHELNPGFNGGKGTYETWIDHNGNVQHNPTYKVRDFLHLENAGLCVHGDINNPSLAGDSLNTNNHLGVTILMGRVYNAVYNDFAETFEKNDKSDKVKPGTLITLNPKTGKYEVCDKFEDKLVVGVTSNTYAFLAGGNRVDGTQDLIDLENEYFTVALCGKVWVRVVNDCLNGNIKPGDLLTSSFEKGKACKSKYLTQGTIIGKALTKPKYFEEEDEYKVLMLVMSN